jgi:5'-3' exonuclease
MQRKPEYMSVDNLIIDGTNLEFRIFYVVQNSKKNTSTEYTQDTIGEQYDFTFKYLQTFQKLVEKFNPTNIYASWDKRLSWPSTNFRKELMGGQYKAGNTKPPEIQEMYDQEIKLIELLETLDVKHIYPNVLEADDVCAWLAHTLSGTNVVVSVDQDLLQLITPKTSVYNLKELITYENFEEKKGIKPENYVLFKSIKGDVSDNISGLEGYGEVRSRKLAENWSNSTLTEEYLKIVEKNIKLIDLKYGYNHQEGELQKYEEQLKYLKNTGGDIEKFTSLCQKYNFVSILHDVSKWKRIINRNNMMNFINKLT